MQQYHYYKWIREKSLTYILTATKEMTNHVFISFSTVQIFNLPHIHNDCILHLLQVHYKLTTWPAPSWLGISVSRALQAMGLNPIHLIWKLHRVSCVFNSNDKSCLHIFLFSSNIWPFIYSLMFFRVYGYITNSQCDQLPVGMIAQLVDHLGSWVWILFMPEFFQALNFATM